MLRNMPCFLCIKLGTVVSCGTRKTLEVILVADVFHQLLPFRLEANLCKTPRLTMSLGVRGRCHLCAVDVNRYSSKHRPELASMSFLPAGECSGSASLVAGVVSSTGCTACRISPVLELGRSAMVLVWDRQNAQIMFFCD